MSYTWGYIKENVLSKLNLTEEEANQQGFLSRFPYCANEAMTQICSGIKPREMYFSITIRDKQKAWTELTTKYNLYTDYKEYSSDISEPDRNDENYAQEVEFWNEWNSYYFTEEPFTLPDDFISFSTDIVWYKVPSIYIRGILVQENKFEEASDEFVEYFGYNQIICHKIGDYKIPYNARWFFFTKDLQNYTEISAPADILDAIPSYIAAQCFRIDDEARAAIFRNEYEMFLARIDDTTFKSQRGMHITGGW